MKHLLVNALLWGFAAFTFAGPATKPAPPSTRPASMQEMKGELDSGDCRAVLHGVARALALKGKAADDFDRHDLLVLRAEALMRLKEPAAAATAFEQAAKEAADDKDRNDALAMNLLLSHSAGRTLKYIPQKVLKGQKHDPIDIIDAESRKAALAAFYFDESSAVAPAIKAGKAANMLPPIGEALKAINAHRLQTIELAANGNDNETQQAVADLKGRAIDLIAHALDRNARRTDEIGISADESIRQTVLVTQPNGKPKFKETYRRRGVSAKESDELKVIIRDCAQIGAVSQGFGVAIGAQDKRSSETATLAQQADDVRLKAERVLRADYMLH